MTDRDALLKAVCDNPDDDTPRLVFADWLDEHGEPERAEFIRVQIELARGSLGDREVGLKAREQALLGEFGDRWLEPIQPYTAPVWRTWEALGWGEQWWEFSRGFLERMSVDGQSGGGFFAASTGLFRQFPLRGLWFPCLQDYEPIARRPGLRRVNELMLQGSVLAADLGIGELFRSPHASGIRVLHLNGYDDNGHLDLDAVRELAGPGVMPGLKHLDLYGNWASWQFGDPRWARVLAAAELLLQLDRLDLGGTSLRGEGVEAITGSPRVANLRHLDLSENEIGERGARAVLASPYLEGLAVLDLRGIDEIGYQEDPVTPTTRARLVERFGNRVRLGPA